MSYLFSKRHMQNLSKATYQNIQTEYFFWNKSKLPKSFIDDMREFNSDATDLVFQKDAQYIAVSYTLGGETIKKVYDFYVLDYKKLTLENSIVLTDEFFDLFMKKLGCKIAICDGKKTTNQKITKIVQNEAKIVQNVQPEVKIKGEIIKIKKALEDAKKAAEKEIDIEDKSEIFIQIEKLEYLLKIREDFLIKKEKEFIEREQLIKDMEMPYLKAVKTIIQKEPEVRETKKEPEVQETKKEWCEKTEEEKKTFKDVDWADM